MTEASETAANGPVEGQLRQIIEAALLAAGEPLSHAQISALFNDDERPASADISRALEELEAECHGRGIELRKVASGYRLQVRKPLQQWVGRLWKEQPQRYSRAMLETLALVAYRQPITRGEIESVRGVSLRSSIIRTLQEREWIRVVGHRDVPGKPALFGTTKAFLDYFDLNSLDELPTLAEIKDMDNLEPELDLEPRVDPDPDPDPVPEPADSSGDARPQTGPPAAEEPVDATAHDAENQ
jgi:segregation and condensation protein B